MKWLAEEISRHAVGDGAQMIIFSGLGLLAMTIAAVADIAFIVRARRQHNPVRLALGVRLTSVCRLEAGAPRAGLTAGCELQARCPTNDRRTRQSELSSVCWWDTA